MFWADRNERYSGEWRDGVQVRAVSCGPFLSSCLSPDLHLTLAPILPSSTAMARTAGSGRASTFPRCGKEAAVGGFVLGDNMLPSPPPTNRHFPTHLSTCNQYMRCNSYTGEWVGGVREGHGTFLYAQYVIAHGFPRALIPTSCP